MSSYLVDTTPPTVVAKSFWNSAGVFVMVWSMCFWCIPEIISVTFSGFWTLGCLRGAKVSCISRHRGVQLILAYSWARPAILVAGKGRGGLFLFLLFLDFHWCSSFFPVFHLFYYSISFLPFSGRRHKMIHKGWHVVKPQHKIWVLNLVTFRAQIV